MYISLKIPTIISSNNDFLLSSIRTYFTNIAHVKLMLVKYFKQCCIKKTVVVYFLSFQVLIKLLQVSHFQRYTYRLREAESITKQTTFYTLSINIFTHLLLRYTLTKSTLQFLYRYKSNVFTKVADPLVFKSWSRFEITMVNNTRSYYRSLLIHFKCSIFIDAIFIQYKQALFCGYFYLPYIYIFLSRRLLEFQIRSLYAYWKRRLCLLLDE